MTRLPEEQPNKGRHLNPWSSRGTGKAPVYETMSDADCRAYDAYMDDILVQNDVFYTAKLEGLEQGRAEGHEEGRAEAIWAIARNELCCARSYYKGKSCSYIS